MFCPNDKIEGKTMIRNHLAIKIAKTKKDTQKTMSLKLTNNKKFFINIKSSSSVLFLGSHTSGSSCFLKEQKYINNNQMYGSDRRLDGSIFHCHQFRLANCLSHWLADCKIIMIVYHM